jgi:LCP family protein required for cell wall assembly
VLRWIGLVAVAAVATAAGFSLGWLQKTVAQVEANDPITVNLTKRELQGVTAGGAVNILVLGSDRRENLGDKGRSDTMMLVRLDPNTKLISMLSVPRDLWVDIPGYGQERINVAYTLGGPALAVKVFKQLTGLPINHFIDVNFLGFCDIVDDLKGVYVDVDRRYYNPPGTGWAAIDLQPGYQLLTGRQALSFVRFRHDATGDFMRMVRQQTFLHDLERQGKRWSNWTKIPAMVKSISKRTISDISSLSTLISMAKMTLSMNTSHVYHSRVLGSGVMIDGKSVVQATPEEIAQAVDDFLDPRRAPVSKGAGGSIPRSAYVVRVLNGSGRQGVATGVANQLAGRGYRTQVAGNADAFKYESSVIYATTEMSAAAETMARLLKPAEVRIIPRLPGTLDGLTVIVGSKYAGSLTGQKPTEEQQVEQIVPNAPQAVSSWQALSAQTAVKVQMPTTWATGMIWQTDQFRTYTIPTGSGQRAAVVAVATTPNGYGYWHIEETTWLDPPLLSDPNEARTIDGREYRLYYQNDHLHRIVWQDNGTLYWITNTLDDQLSNTLMLALATSCKPVR